MAGVALYNFHSREEDELNLSKGEKFLILEKYDDGWWLIERNEEQGLIPSNYAKEIDDLSEDTFPLERDEENRFSDVEEPNSPLKKGFFKGLKPEGKSPISRMQGEREQVNAKIDAIRTVVTNYETGKMNQSIDKKEIIKTTSVDPEETTSSVGSTSPIRKPRFIRASSEQKIKPIPQVQLDPSSIDYISKLINDKITREFNERDKKLIDQVHDIVSQTLSHVRRDDRQTKHSTPATAASADPNGYDSLLTDYDNRSVNSNNNNNNNNPFGKPTKIPRIKLPKINSSNNADSKPGSSRNNSNNNNNNNRATPDIQVNLPPIKSKLPSDKHNKPVKEEQLSMEGIQYSQCRSVVYPSVNDIDLLKTRHLRKSPKLFLRHIFGYDGDPTRHGGSIRGKNIIWLSDNEIAFPAAAVVVIMNVKNEKQKFFVNHTDDVISLASYTALSIIASSQLGSDGSILIWNYKEINQQNGEASPCNQLLPPPGVRGINNLSFSPDGKLLLACGIEDSKMVYIYDWQKNIILTSAKTGHSENCPFHFNPFCFTSFEDENRLSLQGNNNNNGNQKKNDDIIKTVGCYTITSYSGKILKFWTLKQITGLGIGKGKEHQPRSKQNRSNVQYVFEGTQGTFGVKKMGNNSDYSSVSHIGYDTKLNYLLVGLINGSIQVWKHQTEMIDGRLSWIARGKLILVIADVHEHAITEMDYSLPEGRFITSDTSGVLNVWNVNISLKITEGIPLEHIGAIQLDGNSSARSLTWNHTGSAIAIGASNNSISILKLNPLTNGLTEFDLQILLNAHNGKVRRLAIHPLQDNYFATICSDSTIRIWDSELKLHISCISLETPATAISFSNDGYQLAIGNEKGELILLYCQEFENLLTRSKNTIIDQSTIFEWKLMDSKVISSNSNATKSSKKKSEITEIKYCPSEDIMAVGLKDGTIHLLSIRNGYRHVSICRGHTSHIKNIDFSVDGKVLKSSDGSRELLYWDVGSGQQLTNSNYYREQQWNTFSCIYGWGLQGIFNRYDGEKLIQPDSEINCVGRSPDGLILAGAGSHTGQQAIKIFQYPAIADAIPSFFGGHTSPVLDLAFTGPDEYLTLISAGGNDSCVFVWDVIYDN